MIPENKHPQVIAYTDGSCLKNPGGRSGSAAVLVYPDGSKVQKVQGYPSSTSNRAELLAALDALESVDPGFRILIRSDSRYVVDGLRKHLSGGHSLPNANRDLWIRVLDAARAIPDVRTEWIRGHNGDPGNELADQLAGEAATYGPWIKDDQTIPEPAFSLFPWPLTIPGIGNRLPTMNHLGLPHPLLLQYLPDRLLRSVHLLVCNLRGRQWGSQKPRLLFVSRNSWDHLLAYHGRVLHELRARGFHPSPRWRDSSFRGQKVSPWPPGPTTEGLWSLEYPEHRHDAYVTSLAYLRLRMRAGNWTDTDRMRVALAPPEMVGWGKINPYPLTSPGSKRYTLIMVADVGG